MSSADELAATLGAPLPSDFARLGESDFAFLDEAITAASTQRANDLTAGIESALKLVPFPLRKVVKKVLGL